MPAPSNSAIQRHFMVMWTITETFGGMTSMCLRRARNFEALLGRPTPVLCFQLLADTRALSEALVERGHLVPGMQIWNVFAHYRKAALCADADHPVAVPLPSDARPPEGPGLTTEKIHDDDGHLFATLTKTADNVIAFRECLRADGTPYLLDVSRLADDGSVTGRDLWLIDADGAAVRHFASPTRFYYHWLNELSHGEPTAFVFDDKVAARNLRGYAPAHVVKLVVVHSNHVAAGGDAMRGRLEPNRELILTNQHQWDGVVFLTDAARDDYEQRFGATGNHFVVPNPSPPPHDAPTTEREPTRGVMVAQLRPVKNMGAALRAIDLARQTVPAVHLDIFGEGMRRAQIEAEIADLGLDANVTLHGHVSGAASKFAGAGFSLMTSRYEGSPLVLLESMARGCPPISFDFNYGPRSIITDGVDGDVVPMGDEVELAARIVRRCQAPETIERLGQAARRRSLDFTDAAVTQQWVEVIARVWERRPTRSRVPLTRPTLEIGPVTYDGTAEIGGQLRWQEKDPARLHQIMTLRLQSLPPGKGGPVELPVKVTARDDRLVCFVATLRPEDLGSLEREGAEPDLYLIVVAGDACARLTVPTMAHSVTTEKTLDSPEAVVRRVTRPSLIRRRLDRFRRRH